MKIAFFWTWEFSSNILKWVLQNKEVEVVLAVSQPDKPFWRKQELMPTPLKQTAIENNIEVMQPEKLKNSKWQPQGISPTENIDVGAGLVPAQIKDFYEKLKSLNLDFIVVVAYGKIIPVEILEIPKYGSINIHWSILPNYRWASPIQESLKNWDTKTWLTIMYMSAWMDEWDMLKIEDIDIDILDKSPDIFKKFENIWPKLLIETLKWVISWEIKWIPQDNEKATYCKKIEKENGKIDFENETVTQIYNKFRAYNPWPWIYTFYNEKKFDITDCFFEENDIIFDEDFKLWDVVEFEDHWKNSIWILCNWGILILNKVKLEWKKEMPIKDFLNWNKDFLDYNFIF